MNAVLVNLDKGKLEINSNTKIQFDSDKCFGIRMHIIFLFQEIQFKMSSAEVVCCMLMLTSRTNFRIQTISVVSLGAV